jgi:hypothetical protein
MPKDDKTGTRVFNVRARVRRDGYTLKEDKEHPATKGKKGAIVNALNKAFGDNDHRKIALGWLFFYDDVPPLEPKSSKSLEPGHWLAIERWIDADPDNNWEPCEDFVVESELVKQASISAFGSKVEEYDIVDPDDYMTKQAIGLGGTYAEE